MPKSRLSVDLSSEGILDNSISYSFDIDVTNKGTQTVCIPVLNTTTRILNEVEDMLGCFSVFIAGGNFRTVNSNGVASFNAWILPGESRVAYAKGPGIDSEFDLLFVLSRAQTDIEVKPTALFFIFTCCFDTGCN